MNKLDTSAYREAFQAIFSKVKQYHPDFKVGKTLSGIICDWSDTQMRGLEEVIGVKVTHSVVKGCQQVSHILYTPVPPPQIFPLMY